MAIGADGLELDPHQRTPFALHPWPVVVPQRKKKLSKAVYGTSHTISLDEPKYVYHHGEGAPRLIIGAGRYRRVALHPRLESISRKRCEVVLLPTPEVIATWNEATGNMIGLFHVTC